MARRMLLLYAVLAGSCGDVDRAPALRLAELPSVDTAAVLKHTTELASDRYEGRAPGGTGEDLTVGYLEKQLRTMGLEPGAPDGSYIQRVPLIGITSKPASLDVTGPAGRLRLAWRDDVVATTRRVLEVSSIDDSELVFVGYGTVAPEFSWDDYKGVDVTGKTLVMLVNDPPVRSLNSADGLDPAMFGGPAMTYYGRWTYKYDIASQKGAAGVFLIHETGAAGYPFDVVQSSWTGEQFDLVAADGNMGRVAVEGWLSLDAGRRLIELAGHDFDALLRAAATPVFKPVPLGLRASLTLVNELRTVDSRNVIARLPGNDPDLADEAVIYTAHWDHLGIGAPQDDDAIFNGARDNAIGTAGLLEIARAFRKLERAPRRSILFAAVTAEERGLLGSRYYTEHPTVPMSKTAAAINIDTLNVSGPTSDLTVIGLGASELDDYLRDALAEQQRTVVADPSPETGRYYRSDHFSFAKAGVPALYSDAGVTFRHQPAGFGAEVRNDYLTRIYHRPADEVEPGWDLSGAAEDLQALFAVGYRVAQSERLPEWAPRNEFRSIREASFAEGR